MESSSYKGMVKCSQHSGPFFPLFNCCIVWPSSRVFSFQPRSGVESRTIEILVPSVRLGIGLDAETQGEFHSRFTSLISFYILI